jgi:HK97 gp10 family phage protein
MSKRGGVFGKIKGTKGISKAFDKAYEGFHAGKVELIRDTTLKVHETAVKLIQAKSSGETQIRYNPKRSVTASKPGDAPNTDRGRLIQSIKFDFANKGLSSRVGTNLKYGRDLEFGTKKMEARPWLSTAIRIVAKGFKKEFSQVVKDAIKSVGKK